MMKTAVRGLIQSLYLPTLKDKQNVKPNEGGRGMTETLINQQSISFSTSLRDTIQNPAGSEP